jgi:hypothetical protein
MRYLYENRIVSCIVGRDGTYYCCYTCKDDRYPNSFNIKYATSVDGATWKIKKEECLKPKNINRRIE